MMGASGDRGKNITAVLQSPLGLGAQTAPNTAIPGSPMPVYSGDRGYRPPPPRAPGAPPPPRPSLFGPLEARRDWAVAKVRELEAIAADPNRSQADRESARRGARLITRDIGQYQGMPFTQADLDAEANPLLARMDSWEKPRDTGSASEPLPDAKINLEALPEVGKDADNLPAMVTPSDPSLRIPGSYTEVAEAMGPLADESRAIRNEWRQHALSKTDLKRRMRDALTSPEEVKDLRRRIGELNQKMVELMERQKAIASRARELVAIPSAARGEVKWKHKLVGRIGDLAKAAADLKAQYVHGSLMPSISVEITPDTNREGYDPKTKTIRLKPTKTSISTGMHEIAHAIEHQGKGILRETYRFLASRCVKNEKSVGLDKIYPNMGFKPTDRLFRDKWQIRGGDLYTGRFYLNENGRVCATEVLTVGLQRLHADPADFFDQDPEFFRFIVTTLR